MEILEDFGHFLKKSFQYETLKLGLHIGGNFRCVGKKSLWAKFSSVFGPRSGQNKAFVFYLENFQLTRNLI